MTWSSKLLWARPVLIFMNSLPSALTLFAILWAASLAISAIIGFSVVHPCTQLPIPPDDTLQCTALVDIEYSQSSRIIPAHHHGGLVHGAEPAIQYLVVGQVIEAVRLRVGDRIGVIHAIHLGRLEHQIGADFRGSQAGRSEEHTS